MSREHFHESQIEDRITELMEEGMSDEDAIQKAESEYHGQVNLVEDQALKINKRQVAFQKALRQGVYPSEIVLAMVVEYLQDSVKLNTQVMYNTTDGKHRNMSRDLLIKINDWTLEVANAE